MSDEYSNDEGPDLLLTLLAASQQDNIDALTEVMLSAKVAEVCGALAMAVGVIHSLCDGLGVDMVELGRQLQDL